MICSQMRKWMKWIAVTLVAFGSVYGIGRCFHQEMVDGTNVRDVTELYEMPKGAGVNLGGWLVLEDWFFSGSSGSCLTPLGHNLSC